MELQAKAIRSGDVYSFEDTSPFYQLIIIMNLRVSKLQNAAGGN